MTVPWSAYLPDVLPYVPGCPDPVAEHALRRAAQQFFEATLAWQVLLDPIPVGAAEAEISVIPDDRGHELVRVEDAWLDGVTLDVKTAAEMADDTGEEWTVETGKATAIVQLSAGTLRLYPVPTEAATRGLVLRISVKPSDAANGMPDEISVKHARAIRCGARASLLLLPKQPWTDMALGEKEERVFLNELIPPTRIAAARSGGKGRIKARPSWC